MIEMGNEGGNGCLDDINAAMGLELDADPVRAAEVEAEIAAEELLLTRRQYRCAALTGILASGQQHSPIGAAELACAFADLMMEREK